MNCSILLGAAGLVCMLGCGSTTANPIPGVDSGTGQDSSLADANNQNEAGGDGAVGNCNPTCAAGMVCDPLDTKCKPDGSKTHIGDPCNTSGADPLCGTDPKATCNDETQDGFPKGYCSWEPCSATVLCPLGASCAHLGGEPSACWKNCTTGADCRNNDPKYECLSVDPLFTSGGSHKVCYLKDFPCVTSADCPTAKPTCTGANADAGTPGLCK